MKKLKAFTMVELIVVMIISIITLATIYTVYALVKKQFLKQTKKTELINIYLQFKNTFTSDFRNADSIKGTIQDNRLACYLDNDSIIYSFTDKVAIRKKNDFIDSFTLFPQKLEISVIEKTELVNEFSVSLVPLTDTILLQLTKEYDANCLIKFN